MLQQALPFARRSAASASAAAAAELLRVDDVPLSERQSVAAVRRCRSRSSLAPGGSRTRRALEIATCRLLRALGVERPGHSASKIRSSGTGRVQVDEQEPDEAGVHRAPPPVARPPRTAADGEATQQLEVERREDAGEALGRPRGGGRQLGIGSAASRPDGASASGSPDAVAGSSAARRTAATGCWRNATSCKPSGKAVLTASRVGSGSSTPRSRARPDEPLEALPLAPQGVGQCLAGLIPESEQVGVAPVRVAVDDDRSHARSASRRPLRKQAERPRVHLVDQG